MRFTEFKNSNKELESALVNTLMNVRGEADDKNQSSEISFGAVDAEAGGTEPEGREQRESKEVFEQSNRIYSKLARK